MENMNAMMVAMAKKKKMPLTSRNMISIMLKMMMMMMMMTMITTTLHLIHLHPVHFYDGGGFSC